MIGSSKISLGLISKAMKDVTELDPPSRTFKGCYRLKGGFRQIMVLKKEGGVWYLDAESTIKETKKYNPIRTVEEVD